ncbi:MAG: hypothetical protein R3E10_04970 [Gemmatimonadota bacterium]
MKRWGWAAVALALGALGACDDNYFGPGGVPDPPLHLTGSYYNYAVTLRWELASGWNGESFRVYSKRTSDPQYFLIADVTSCAEGVCEYADVNIVEGQRYEYFVAAVDPDSGEEADSSPVVVDVPDFDPPPVPTGLHVLGLDEATFVTWGSNARQASDFSFYRLYLDDGQGGFLLGETDSEGFVDLLAVNGETSTYRVAAVDQFGHESVLSASASGTPRPDYTGELLYAFEDRPLDAGFRFRESDQISPVVRGDAPERHFRLEVDANGLWLVPGPGTQIHAQGFATSALTCGVGADPDCVSVEVAPAGGYTTQDVPLLDQTTYPMRVLGDDGQTHYGAIRVQGSGFDQAGDALVVLDWSYQLQPGNPALNPRGRIPTPVR